MALSFGVCCMANKATSKPMQALLAELRKGGELEILVFAEGVILREPVEHWPRVQILLAFASGNFPLDKCLAYCRLHQPVLINDIEAQHTLCDRVKVYKTLRDWSIPCPEHVIVDHLAPTSTQDFAENEDWVSYKGQVLKKPFVEKPLDGDRHDIFIYHASDKGGGATKLQRKDKDESSKFDREHNSVRRDGTYIYEGFLDTDKLDYKCYAVGKSYVLAEARKAPTVDGKVLRVAGGKEAREQVALSDEEKQISSRVVEAFKQFVCGFDILRTKDGRSIVCDVNGWSFVKGNPEYTNRCAALIRQELLKDRRLNDAKSPRVCGAGRGMQPLVVDTLLAEPACSHDENPSGPRETAISDAQLRAGKVAGAKIRFIDSSTSRIALLGVVVLAGFASVSRLFRQRRNWIALISIALLICGKRLASTEGVMGFVRMAKRTSSRLPRLTA